MVNNGCFKNDLKLGQEYERKAQVKVIDFLKSDGNVDEVTVIEERNDNMYDFKMSDNSTYEVKYDRMAGFTGNIFIEYESHARLAGISVSQADFYIICVGTPCVFYRIKTADLKQMIRDEKYFRIHDDASKAGYLFKLSVLADNSIIL